MSPPTCYLIDKQAAALCHMLIITSLSKCGIGLDYCFLASFYAAAGNTLSILVVQKLTDSPPNLDHNQSECVINKADPSQVGLLSIGLGSTGCRGGPVSSTLDSSALSKGLG